MNKSLPLSPWPSLTFATGYGAAAELRLKAQCTPAAAIVTLGDVADIASADARQSATLAAIELFPAPAAGEEKVVRVREIQDLLLLRGVNLARAPAFRRKRSRCPSGGRPAASRGGPADFHGGSAARSSGGCARPWRSI